MPGSVPVRKFPSNFEIPTQFLQPKRMSEESPENRKRNIKRAKMANFEMPTFTLGNDPNYTLLIQLIRNIKYL